MQVIVSATLNSPTVFGGSFPGADCRVMIGGGQSLIYAALEPFDVLAALDRAFGLGLEGESLTVASAGFFTWSHSSAVPAGQAPTGTFEGTPIPASIPAAAPAAGRTTCLWLSAGLGGGSEGAFGSLLDIGVSSGTELTLSATLASGADAASGFRSATYTASLAGTISLFGIFEFDDLSIAYQAGTATRLSLSGNVGVTLFGSSFTFAGSVVSDSATRTITADLTASGSTTLGGLFDGAFRNISFSNLSLCLYSPYRNAPAESPQATTGSLPEGGARFMLRGSCDFAGLAFTGLLYLQGDTPTLASVVFTQPASISTLFDQCLPGASWPTSFFDLTLKAGTQVYYSDCKQDIVLTLAEDGTGPTLLPVLSVGSTPAQSGEGDGATPAAAPPPAPTTYRPGFNVAASFQLELLDAIDLSGDLSVDDHGVTASIDIAHPIELYIVQITRIGDSTAGPVLSFSTQDDEFSFSGALLFLGADFGADVTVKLGRDGDGNPRLSGTLSPAQDYPGLFSTSHGLSLSYSKTQGFTIGNWPKFQSLKPLVNFASELNKLVEGGSGNCGSLAGLVSDTIGQTYSISPTFSLGKNGASSPPGSAAPAAKPVLSLTISCDLSFEQQKFATISLPDAIELDLDGLNLEAGSDNLLTAIESAIGQAAVSFAKALLADPDACAQFLLLAAGKEAAEYAATLTCEELADDVVKLAVDAAIADTEAEVGTDAVALLVIAAIVAAALEGADRSGSDKPAAPAPAKPPAGPAPAKPPAGPAPAKPPTAPAPAKPPAAPAGVGLNLADSGLNASWQPSADAQNYWATLTGPGLRIDSPQLPHDTNSFLFDCTPPESLPALVRVAVTASNGAGTSSEAEAQLLFLAPPTGFAVSRQPAVAPEVTVCVAWTGAEGATDYAATVSGAGSPALARTGNTVLLNFTPADPAGPYRLEVVSHGDANSVSSPAASFELIRLEAPRNLRLDAAEAGIVAAWDPVAGAADYLVLWTDPSGANGSAEAEATAQAACSLTLPAPPAAGRWTVAVQARPVAEGVAAVAGPPCLPEPILIAPRRSPAELARVCFALHVDGVACAERLVVADPALAPAALAGAMAGAGYPLSATASGLAAVLPSITAAAAARILYPLYADQPAVELAQALLALAPGISRPDLIDALTEAGIPSLDALGAVNLLRPLTCVVEANQGWQDSGLVLNGLQSTALSCRGVWTANPATGFCDADGHPGLAGKPGYTLPGAWEGALIGRLGDAAPFLVGRDTIIPPGPAGPLSLCINDDLSGEYGTGLADNAGALTVTISSADPS